jgi:hypothetical protein
VNARELLDDLLSRDVRRPIGARVRPFHETQQLVDESRKAY